MINIQVSRHGLIVVAAVVNDDLDITTAIGLTGESATRRLLARLGN